MLKNNMNPFKVMIITCWILLILAFICKLFGANWFEPSIDNAKFIKFCNWLDNHWQIYIISTLVYVPATYLIYLTITKQYAYKDLWTCILLIPCSYLKDGNYILIILGFILELIVIAIIPMIKLKHKDKLRILFILDLIFMFQLMSNITKIYTWNLKNTSSLVSIILSIDYYILIILMYLYSIKEVKKNEMGNSIV